MSDNVLATDPAAATELVARLQDLARGISKGCVADPGGDAVFGPAAAALAAIPSTSGRLREGCADVLIALAAGVAVAQAGTAAADSW
jgi:hypothetical protein